MSATRSAANPLLLALAIGAVLAAPAEAARRAPAGSAAKVPATPSAVAAPAPTLISRDALFGNPERSNVQLSPDGKYLSWAAPLDGTINLWVAPADNPGAAKAVTKDKARGIRNYFWSYQPGTLLYSRDTGGDEDFHLFAVDVAAGTERDLTPFPKTRAMVMQVSQKHPGAILVGMNDRDAQWHDAYRVDLKTGKRTLVAKNTDEIASYVADPDYKLRIAMRSRPDGGQDILEPAAGGTWTKTDDLPFEDSLTTQPVGYTADGKTLYLVDSRGRNTAALFSTDRPTGKKTLLFEDARADAGETLVDPKTGVVQAASANYLRTEWKALDPKLSADLETLKTLGPGETTVNSRTLDDRTWIVAYSAAETPVSYYRYDRDKGGTLTKLFSARPQLEGVALAPMWPEELKSRDGKTLVSYLTLPLGADANHDGKADKPVPLVLFVHGGPWGRDEYGYSSYPQWLANRGYAVLSVNYRGSTGFGKEFTNDGDQQWAAKMHDDLLDAVQWAVSSGVTTPDQVAIMGGSYGGYATLVGMTFTPDTFACGVDIVGPSNLNTLLGTIPPYWKAQFEQFTKRVGDPRTEEGKALLAERSPLTHVAQIKHPLLIGQGANDPRVKQAEADQIVQAMKAKSIPVTYVLFPDEGHGFQRPNNSKAFNAVTEGFLQQCLGGGAQPIGADFAGSSIGVPEGAAHVPGLAAALKDHVPQVRK